MQQKKKIEENDDSVKLLNMMEETLVLIESFQPKNVELVRLMGEIAEKIHLALIIHRISTPEQYREVAECQ